MITVPRCFRAAGVVMILASLSGAGDPPGFKTNSDRVAAAPPCDDRPGARAGWARHASAL